MIDVEIVGFDYELLEQASVLRADEFGGTPERNHRYLVWKYLRNPYIEMPIVQFGVHAGEVIGMRGSMGTCWEAGGSRHVIPHGGDLVVHPRFRRRGIARQMHVAAAAEMKARGYACAISLNAGRGAPSALASGWTAVAELGVSRSARAPIRERVGRRLRATVRTRITHPPGSAVATPFAELTSHIEDDVTVWSTASASDLAEIAARAATDDRLRHVRDEAYFEWRLADPLSTFQLLVTPDAYLILQWSGIASHVNVVDWRSAASDALSGLARTTVRYVRPLCVWTASVDAHVAPMLSDGTFEYGTGATFALRTLQDDTDALTVGGLDPRILANWHLQMLDADF